MTLPLLLTAAMPFPTVFQFTLREVPLTLSSYTSPVEIIATDFDMLGDSFVTFAAVVFTAANDNIDGRITRQSDKSAAIILSVFLICFPRL